jgi:gas vesicle protein
MLRKPPSKLEQLQDSAVNALDALRDAVADLPADRVSKTVAQKAEAARRAAAVAQKNAAHVAAGAGQTAAHGLEAARERTAHVASGAASGVSHAAHATGDVLSSAAHTVSDAVTGAVGAAGSVLSGAVHGIEDKWHALRGGAADAGENAHATATNAHESAAHAISNAASLAAAKAASAARAVSRRSVTLPAPVEVEEKESSSRWLWMLVGVLAGAAIMLLLAPSSGRRNRALVTDKLRKAKHGAQSLGGAAVAKAHDLKNRAEGAIHERTAGGADDADDITIADRVRTAIGEAEATRNLDRLNIDCVHGLVTVRGPMADAELQAAIEKVVRAVKGVTDVKLDLLLDESEDENPTFVG